MRGRQEERKSLIHAAESRVHVVVLHRIAAIGRQHARILLRSTQAEADRLFGDVLHVAFEHHLVRHVVLLRIALVEHHGIACAEVGQRFFPATPSGQLQVGFMDVGGMVVLNGQVVDDFARLAFLVEGRKPQRSSPRAAQSLYVARFRGIEFLRDEVVERIEIAFLQRRQGGQFLRQTLDRWTQVVAPEPAVQLAFVQYVGLQVLEFIGRIFDVVS